MLGREFRSIVGYWRASLADGLLPGVPKGEKRNLSAKELASGALSGPLTDKLFRDWQRAGKGRDDDASVPVLIAPLVFLPLHAHGSARRKQDEPFCPIIVPASLTRLGALSFDPAKLPWIDRRALEPSAAPEPSLGRLEDFDAFRSTTRAPEATCEAFAAYVAEMCRAVAGCEPDAVEFPAYARGKPLVMAALPPASPARHLMRVADHLLDHCAAPPGALAGLLRDEAPRPLLDGGWPAHLGQMNGAYPLADLQREALRHALACRAGELLAVNGPPGTGKTTLLQSIVASLYVAAALDDGAPPVVFATSTNNQAVTNVIDSFAAAAPPPHRRDDPMAGRWLPGVRSYALFLPSAAAKADGDKYQLARIPKGKDTLSGFPADLLRPEALAEAQTAFLAAAGAALGRRFDAVVEVRTALHGRLRELAGRLNGITGAATALVRLRAAHYGVDAAAALAAIDADAAALRAATDARQAEVAALRRQAAAEVAAADAFEAAAERAKQALLPKGLVDLILGWFSPAVRANRWDECRRIMAALGEDEGPFASLAVPPEEAVRLHLAAKLEKARKAGRPAIQAADAAKRAADTAAREAEAALQVRREALRAWTAAEESWAGHAQALAALAAPALPGIDAGRLVAAPAQAERVLDVTWRHDLFLLATHYWEARWLLAADELADGREEPLRRLSRQKRDDAVFRLHYLALLTPCFVATAYMLPDHLQYWDPAGPDGARSEPPLLDAVDLLIVDEAGQVPPEIGALPLAFARRALVVGDVHQIEPVWSIGPEIDHGNLAEHGLDGEEEALDAAGALARNGSLMKLARRASAFTRADDQGMFLEEHRRCQAAMVKVCNDLVYRGRLKPRSQLLADPLLPALGWAHVRSASGKRGTSRINVGEAEAIAEWLARRRAGIEARYGKPLEQLVGVVTPFGAQKGELRAALTRHGIGAEMTVGTVHALQGAEREIVLFSPTHTAEDGADAFFDRGPNMLNVAVSRAKHAFLAFGDMRMFDPGRHVPSGKLARHLFGPDGAEIADVLSRPEFVAAANAADTIRIETLQEHRDLLRGAFETAASRVLVVSPYLRINAVRDDGLDAVVRAAVARGTKVTLVYDPDQNAADGKPLPATRDAVDALRAAGAEMRRLRRIHSKTLAVDDAWIAEGSFNWLSAVRDAAAPYARMERSLQYRGPRAADYVAGAWAEVAVVEAVEAAG